MNFDDLTDEQKAKAREAKTPEDILALAKEEGYELSDEELEAVSGGWVGNPNDGPDCEREGCPCNCPGHAH